MIEKNEILGVQKEWGDALIKIGSLKDDRASCEIVTKEVIDRLYAFDLGNVLFKPTRANEVQFRGTIEGALSYFIGGSDQFPEDTGFALQPWEKVTFDNAGGILLAEHQAIAMGNYFFTEAGTGEISQVEYTFGYVRGPEGNLKITLHHSSIPFSPSI